MATHHLDGGERSTHLLVADATRLRPCVGLEAELLPVEMTTQSPSSAHHLHRATNQIDALATLGGGRSSVHRHALHWTHQNQLVVADVTNALSDPLKTLQLPSQIATTSCHS